MSNDLRLFHIYHQVHWLFERLLQEKKQKALKKPLLF
jgi:hypothetical protein